MNRKLTVTLDGPRVAEWIKATAGEQPAGPYFHRNAKVAPGLYVVAVDVAWTTLDNEPIPGYVTIAVVDQGAGVDDPDELVKRALERINEHVDGLVGKADQLEIRLERA